MNDSGGKPEPSPHGNRKSCSGRIFGDKRKQRQWHCHFRISELSAMAYVSDSDPNHDPVTHNRSGHRTN